MQGKGTPDASTIGWDELLLDMKATDTPVTVTMTSTDSGDWVETGTAIITSLKMSGTTGDKVTYSGDLQGSGSLVTSAIS